MENVDFRIIGLTFQLIGISFIAISIVFKKPRRVLEEIFGVASRHQVRQIRDVVFKQNQIVLGIVLLGAGYLFQLCGIIEGRHPAAQTSPGFSASWSPAQAILFVVASVVAFTFLLNAVGLIWTRRSFNRLMARFLRENNWAVEENIQLTREIGDLVGVESSHDSSIEEYLQNFRRKLRLVEEVD